jgi:hypothetical protein
MYASRKRYMHDLRISWRDDATKSASPPGSAPALSCVTPDNLQYEQPHSTNKRKRAKSGEAN